MELPSYSFCKVEGGFEFKVTFSWSLAQKLEPTRQQVDLYFELPSYPSVLAGLGSTQDCNFAIFFFRIVLVPFCKVIDALLLAV